MRSFIHNISLKLDVIGFSASTLCAIHCALMPFVITVLPLVGLEFMASHEVEYTMVGLSILIGSVTFIHGYYKHHKKLKPLLLFLLGLFLIIAGHYFFPEPFEYILAPIGALIIATSHLINRKYIIKYRSCSHD